MMRAAVVIASLALLGMSLSCGDDDAETTGAGGSSSSASSSSATSGSGGSSTMPNPLPAGCWTGAPPLCNPLDNTPCMDSEACDVGTMGLRCFGGENGAAEGDACNPSSGPFCMPTLHCAEAVCRRFCCSDADCSGNTCEAVQPQNGTLGVCPAP